MARQLLSERWSQVSSSGHQSIAFTGSSLVCSLGVDVAGACAALRAGLVRPTVIDTFVVGTLDASGGATAHAVPVLTHGFEGEARLLRLLQAMFEGLGKPSDAPWAGARTGFYLSLPHPERQYSGFELIVSEAIRRQEIAKWQELRTAQPEQTDLGQHARSLIGRAAMLAGWPVQLRAFSMNGNTGVAELIDAAGRDLLQGAIDVAVVGGVDSWIDGAMLRWLEQRGRLKSAAMPVGMAPGEAGGFLVMETASGAHARGAEILGILRSTLLDRDEHAHLDGKASLGTALARVLAGAAAAPGWSTDAPPWLVVDQNGERYRAHEWGCALTRLVDAHPVYHEANLWYPVSGVGDTGAATGAVQAIVALQAFRRGYAPNHQAVLLAGADAGHRSATLLGASI